MTDKIRIIHAIDSLGIGGAQTMMFELHDAIAKYYPEYVQNIVLLNKEKKDTRFIESYGIKYSNINSSLFSKTILSYNENEKTVLIYHKLMCSKTTIYNNLFLKVPIIVVNHTYTESNVFNRINNCTCVVSVSDYMGKMIRKICPNSHHFTIINGINGYKYDDIPSLVREDKDCLLTGRINSLNTIKFSESWQKWISKLSLTKRVIHEYVGGGHHYKKACSQVLEINKVSNNEVRMIGPIHDLQTKISMVKSWDLFLYEINRHEGVSISILEALACGVPVICSNHFGNKEIIKDGINGYVFESRDHAAKILEDLCIHPEKLDALKKTTLEDFKNNLDAKIVASNYVEVINYALSNFTILKSNLKKRMKENNRKHFAIKQVNNNKRFVTENSKKNIKIKNLLSTSDIEMDSDNKKHESNHDSKDKFSILTAGYNNGRYINDWVNSIIKQKYRPLEVVYVNDNSSDNTLSILANLYKKFLEENIELKVINNPTRQFCGSSYHIALENATGQFFGVLDSDDMLCNDAVEYIMSIYKSREDIAWIYTQHYYCASDMKPIKEGLCTPPKPGKSLLQMGKEGRHTYSHWRTFSNRYPKLEKIFCKGLKSAVDKYMGYRLEEFSKGMFANEICYLYRCNSKKSISKTEKTRLTWKNVIEEAINRRRKYKLKSYEIETLERKPK